MTALYHASEDGGIQCFEPRPPKEAEWVSLGNVVWGIDHERLPNYLLPRECPRICFAPGPDSCPEDIERLMGPVVPSRIIAIEASWLDRALRTPLYLYELPADSFRPVDANAGYHVSSEAVTPHTVRLIDSPLEERRRRSVEVRVLPSLWPLRDAVVRSSLQFSCIRLRNAASPGIPNRDAGT